ncbi:MAG: MFS transporter [Enterobacteriaceae bacterium]|uniref:MFS transporter n=1 Tax=Enterobacteriaceae TaxID=543 RepID=UPI000892E175|nr:MFS transporter [Phytobacter diazotrophicus]AUU91410.1 MFS transporter [Enterobacteriaceae bacterium ENNIH3]AUV08573.1 MFS transporter [Enterobacteriaceae bacterium ENNIH2]MDU4998743.1 MFS transporter [Enterobacteriaceae bacterium]PTA96109.1 MFS transporter [Kluyvera sp. Nf5]PWF50155.1 MFS transporter [[Kluyvera] intestini]PXW56754.1 DHA1 family inner membrane transport protein [Grimontella sp. AG753]SLK14947.1 MFS transporter, DHA1 family, arabinose polymer transporter [Enterobacter sp. 
MKINFPLLALAIGAFGIGTTEFSPMGLLPVIAQGVDVSIPAAGMLISAYAIGVMVGAPLMTLLLSHRARRNALVFLMAIFTLGNVLSALSPDYTTLMLSRIITSLNHGAFFGLGSVVAASVVAKEKQASAVATMFMGLTIANIGGVPAATWLGGAIGWRMSFLATAGLGVIAMVSLYFSLPKGSAGERPDVRKELAVLMRPQVVSALLTTVLGAGAMFTLYTYISPVLHRITDATPAFITAMLVLVGVGFSIGNYLGGKLADRSVTATLKGFLLLLIVIMVAIPWLARSEIGAAISMVIWGAATFAVVPPLQMRVMRVAHEAPGLSSSVNIGAFNLGNALGAAAGGAVISGGLGYTVVPVTGAIIAGMALLLVLFSGRASAERTCTAAE